MNWRNYGLGSFGFVAIVVVTTTYIWSATALEANSVVFGESLPNLDAFEQHKFNEGFIAFIKVWKPGDGLGRYINGRSCISCHTEPVPGGSGTRVSTFVLNCPEIADAAGGHVFARFETFGETNRPRKLPTAEMLRRKTPGLFGLGLLESVSDEFLLAQSRANRSKGATIGGRLPRLLGGYGRFGWKSEFSSIRDSVSHAMVAELGFHTVKLATRGGSVSREHDREVSHIISRLTDFCKFLSPPPIRQATSETVLGRRLFSVIGCAWCHSESLESGPGVPPLLQGIVFHPYTDLLLHHMGPRLADKFTMGVAEPDEFRTAPLWGITSMGPPFLHDGRASSLEEAILLHDGQAAGSVAQFHNLTRLEQSRLLVFLASL